MIIALYKYYPIEKGMKRKEITDYDQKTDLLEETTINFCVSGFYKSMNLPCRHVFIKFFLRRETNYSLYDEEFCDKWWMRSYYIKSQVTLLSS